MQARPPSWWKSRARPVISTLQWWTLLTVYQLAVNWETHLHILYYLANHFLTVPEWLIFEGFSDCCLESLKGLCPDPSLLYLWTSYIRSFGLSAHWAVWFESLDLNQNIRWLSKMYHMQINIIWNDVWHKVVFFMICNYLVHKCLLGTFMKIPHFLGNQFVSFISTLYGQ